MNSQEDIGHFPPSADIVDMFNYSREQHPKIFRALKSGRYINEKLRAKLEKRLYHFRNVMRHIAANDPSTVTINITETGTPSAESFMNSWAIGRKSMFTSVALTIPN